MMRAGLPGQRRVAVLPGRKLRLSVSASGRGAAGVGGEGGGATSQLHTCVHLHCSMSDRGIPIPLQRIGQLVALNK